MGFPSGAIVKNPPASAGDIRDMRSIPGSARSPGVGSGNPLQYSCLGNPIDRGPWRLLSMWSMDTVYEVAKDSDMTEQTHTSLHKPQSQS